MDRGSVVYVVSCLITIHACAHVAGSPFRTSECVDSLPRDCSTELEPRYCYNTYNYNLCCRTCESIRRSSEDCPYGDRHTLIQEEDGQTWTCRNYVRTYGRWRCRSPDFRWQCCESCAPIRRPDLE